MHVSGKVLTRAQRRTSPSTLILVSWRPAARWEIPCSVEAVAVLSILQYAQRKSLYTSLFSLLTDKMTLRGRDEHHARHIDCRLYVTLIRLISRFRLTVYEQPPLNVHRYNLLLLRLGSRIDISDEQKVSYYSVWWFMTHCSKMFVI